MKKVMKTCLALAMLLSIYVSASDAPTASHSAQKNVALNSSFVAQSPTNLTSVQLVPLMGVGWNLGNSFESVGLPYKGETTWGNAKVSEALISAVKAAGFKTIRIPIAWSQNFSDEKNFTIKDSWFARIDQVVNYALKKDLFVIINIHWDGGWIKPLAAQQAAVNKRLDIMWKQIATHYRDYDDRLLFAGTNEIMVEGDYSEPKKEYYTAQNSFNQTFVSAVRATAGKNASRFLVVQGFNTNINWTLKYNTIPEDSAANKILMEVHYYDPYNFTLNTKSNITQWGKKANNSSKTETWANESYVDDQFQQMKAHFVEKGVGVVLGEYGVIRRTQDAESETYRVYWNEYITKSALAHSIVPIYWDNGYPNDGGMGLFNRATGEIIFPDIIKAITQTLK